MGSFTGAALSCPCPRVQSTLENACRPSPAPRCANASAQLVTAGCRHPTIKLSSRRTSRAWCDAPLQPSSRTRYGVRCKTERRARPRTKTARRSPTASPQPGPDQRPDPVPSQSPDAHAPQSPRFPGLTPDPFGACWTRPPRGGHAFRTLEAQSSARYTVRTPQREGHPPLRFALPGAREPRHERRSSTAQQLALLPMLDPDPEGPARSLVSRPDYVWTSRRSKSSPNHRRRVLPDACSEGGRLPWGFLPFGACGSGQRLIPGMPPPATRRPRVSSTPRRFAPPISFPAFFHAGSTLELRASRGFPSPVASPASRRDLPLLPFDIDRASSSARTNEVADLGFRGSSIR